MKRSISMTAVLLVLVLCLGACTTPNGDSAATTDALYTTEAIGSTAPSDTHSSGPSTADTTQAPPTTQADSESDVTTEASGTTEHPGTTEAPEATEPTGTTEPSDTSQPETTEPETEPDSNCAHADTNDDGICDTCTVSVLVSLDFFAINDLHGKFNDTDQQIGVDELTTYLLQAKESNPYTLFLSSGDMWQGSSESNLTKGILLTDWMNELGFVSMTLGNHEFDWGIEPIKENAALAEFPILAINVYDRNTRELADFCTPSVLVDKGEVQIGIIGAIGDVYSSISADKVRDIYFVVDDPLTELIKAESHSLRQQGADIIVLSIHDGGGAYDVSLSDGYVDLVFEGHSHKNYVKKDAQGVYHLQGGGDNDGITHANAKVNFVTGSVVIATAEYLPSSRYASFDDHPLIAQLNQKYADQISLGNEMLGYNASKRYSEQILQKVADLYLSYGEKRWGEEYNLVLGGGFLSARSPYDLDKGEVRYSDLQMLLPFDNQIVLCSIKGSDLLNRFINTSNNRYYISLSDYGEDIKNSIDRNATYYIITDTYCSSYAANRLTVIDTYDQTTFARDLIAEYIRDGHWSK